MYDYDINQIIIGEARQIVLAVISAELATAIIKPANT